MSGSSVVAFEVELDTHPHFPQYVGISITGDHKCRSEVTSKLKVCVEAPSSLTLNQKYVTRKNH